MRGSVISSIAYCRPSRPNPESFDAAVRHLVRAERRDVVDDDAADLERRGAPRTPG